MDQERFVPVSDLCLQRDIAERLKINPTKLANLAAGRRNHADFPRPVAGHGQRGVWLWSEVEAWAQRVRELPRLSQPSPYLNDPRRRAA